MTLGPRKGRRTLAPGAVLVERRRVRVHGERGTTTLEWVALLLVLAALVAGVATSGLAGTTRDRVAQALCMLFSGDTGCGPGGSQEPTGEPTYACIRSSVAGSARASLTVAFVKVGGGGGFLVEELSDGTWRVTWADDGELGASAALFEAGGAIRVGGREAGLHAELRGEAMLTGRLSDSRVFRSSDDAFSYLKERLADEAIERLPHGPRQVAGIINGLIGPDGPDGEQGPATGETGIRIQGNFGGSAGQVTGELEAIMRGAARVTALPDGGRIVTVVLQGAAGASAGVPVVAELGGRGARQYLVSLRVDEHGDPVSLRVTAEASGTFRPGLVHTREFGRGFLENLKGTLRDSDTERTLVDYELALDTRERRAASLRFLAAAPRPGEGTSDLQSLHVAVDELWAGFDGITVGVRQYRDGQTTFGLEAKLRALGIVGGGADGEISGTSSRLQGAYYWDTANGGFVPWISCTG